MSVHICAVSAQLLPSRGRLASQEVPGLFGLVTGCSLIFSASLFAGCWRRFRSVSREKGSRINDAQAAFRRPRPRQP
eukprot:1282430-Pleurochrysis_carterae.AAC.1